MRPRRLVVLVGTLAAAGALYLRHLAVDDAAFRALTGVGSPTIWQELGRWGRPAAALVAAGMVASAFRPYGGLPDRLGGVAAVLLAAGAAAGGVLALLAAADDAAVVGAALAAAGVESAAAAGVGFWVLLGGAGAAVAGACWDLAGGRGDSRREPSVREEDAAPLQ